MFISYIFIYLIFNYYYITSNTIITKKQIQLTAIIIIIIDYGDRDY